LCLFINWFWTIIVCLLKNIYIYIYSILAITFITLYFLSNRISVNKNLMTNILVIFKEN
jgi:hypothetical protein